MSDSTETSEIIAFDDFLKVDIRVGTIVACDPFPEARKPAYKLRIDFGSEIGEKKSSAQITNLYDRDQVVGRQVAAVVNFAPRQIGPFMSEVLVLGFPTEDGEVSMITVEPCVPNGGRMARCGSKASLAAARPSSSRYRSRHDRCPRPHRRR